MFMEEDKLNVGFKIVSHDSEGKTLTIRPCSTNFKNHPDSYPLYNINISNLDPTKDLSKQIIDFISVTVKSIVLSEATDAVSSIIKFAESNQNKVISEDKLFSKNSPLLVPPQSQTIHPSSVFEVVSA